MDAKTEMVASQHAPAATGWAPKSSRYLCDRDVERVGGEKKEPNRECRIVEYTDERGTTEKRSVGNQVSVAILLGVGCESHDAVHAL